MKVSIARIRLFLKEGKTLADGSHPIMLSVAFNGKCTRSTGYSCTSKFWDKKGECVKRGYPNYIMINHAIQVLKNQAVERRNTFERLSQPYTSQMILGDREDLCAVGNDLCGLVETYLSEKGLESKTVEKWRVVCRSVVSYAGRSVVLNELSESFCRSYGRWLESRGLSSGSIRSYLAKLGCIYHYGIVRGIVPSGSHPFDSWKYHLDYRESKSELYIHSRSMSVMMDMFIDSIIDGCSDGLWHYREGVVDELLDIHSELYGRYLYVIGYYLCGLAPGDISFLKKSDVRVGMIRDISCYCIDGKRNKTGMPYKIRLRQGCIESNVLIRTMLMYHVGDYFLPTLEGYHGNNIKKRVNNLYTYHSEHLLSWFQMVNDEIVRRNMEHGDDIPLIDLSCRYYSYRHSYIMAEIQKPGVNLLRLATLTGKSVTSLHQYVTLLGDNDLL